MLVQKFEDLIVWQKSQDLAFNLYSLFRESRDFGFKDQILRASVSISNNIAEGFDRKGKVEFKRFLYISKASCSEVKSMLYLFQRIEPLKKDGINQLIIDCQEISRLVQGLINSIEK